MIILNIDRNSKIPLFKQVFTGLKNMIDNQTIVIGDNLPSTRSFAKQLGVNRTTVCKAYDELWALGYIESTSGGYSKVRKRTEIIQNVTINETNSTNWSCKIKSIYSRNKKTTDKYSLKEKSEVKYDFTPLSPDPELIPVEDIRKSISQILLQEGSHILQYGDKLGYRPLREYLAKQMQQHQISCLADEIVLTDGMQNALDMIVKLLTKPGDKVVVEAPSYSSILKLLEFHQLNIISVPMNKEGANLQELEHIFKTEQPAFFYTVPNFHNPTGLSSPQWYREKLLALCESYEIPLLEDGFEEEMKYFGKAVLPIKSMDKKNLVFYMGTFSKILSPGLRVGWIITDKYCIEQLAEMKKICELSGSPLNQAAVYQYCQNGKYEFHKKRVHREYRKRMQAAMKAAREYLSGEKIDFTKPAGGYTFWISISETNKSEYEIWNKCIQEEVAITPGSYFFTEEQKKISFRLSIAHLNEEEITEGIKRIGKVLNKI